MVLLFAVLSVFGLYQCSLPFRHPIFFFFGLFSPSKSYTIIFALGSPALSLFAAEKIRGHTEGAPTRFPREKKNRQTTDPTQYRAVLKHTTSTISKRKQEEDQRQKVETNKKKHALLMFPNTIPPSDVCTRSRNKTHMDNILHSRKQYFFQHQQKRDKTPHHAITSMPYSSPGDGQRSSPRQRPSLCLSLSRSRFLRHPQPRPQLPRPLPHPLPPSRPRKARVLSTPRSRLPLLPPQPPACESLGRWLELALHLRGKIRGHLRER